MAHSFKMMRDQIAELALRRVGVSPRSNTSMWHEKLQDAIQALHVIVRELQDNRGIHLWTIDEIALKMPATSYVATTSTPVTYYMCIKSHTSDSTTIPGGSGPWSAVWAKVDSLPSGVAEQFGEEGPPIWEGSTRYVDGGTADMPDPYLDADGVALVHKGAHHDLELIDGRRFYAMYSGVNRGTPRYCWVERVHWNDAIGARLHVLPLPDLDYSYSVRAVRYLRDMENSSDYPDIPQSMISALSYLLTAELADQYGLPLEERQYFTMKAEMKLSDAKKGYVETTTHDRIRPCY